MSALRCPLEEIDPRHTFIEGTSAYRGTERVSDLAQRRGRRDRQPDLAMHIAHDPRGVLQLRDINVEIHLVGALDLEDSVLGNDIGHSAR